MSDDLEQIIRYDIVWWSEKTFREQCNTDHSIQVLPERETNARPLTNASALWDRNVENWPGQVEFCIEHIKDTFF